MRPAPSYTRLDAAQVHETIDRLRGRVLARFPERHLGQIAAEVGEVAGQVMDATAPSWLTGVRWACRVLTALLGVLAPTLVLYAVWDGLHAAAKTVDWLSIGESAINDLVFAGIAIAFLWALPVRLQRNADLRVLHRLRSLAHVVDMHQLTKDPERFDPAFRNTAATVDPGLTPIEMSHYLDYCSELLSLIGKTAALLAENNTDPTVLAGVQGIEDITNGMSRKIWQKIALLPHPPSR